MVEAPLKPEAFAGTFERSSSQSKPGGQIGSEYQLVAKDGKATFSSREYEWGGMDGSYNDEETRAGTLEVAADGQLSLRFDGGGKTHRITVAGDAPNRIVTIEDVRWGGRSAELDEKIQVAG